MLILPAIDLKDGRVVRLYQGDFSTTHQVAEDPVSVAREFYDSGARYLHMVDLNGARDGVRKNEAMVRAVANVGLRVELGGGLRTMGDLEAAFALGIYRAVIGSAAVNDPEFVAAAVERYGQEKIAVGIDARDGLVKTAGWVEDSGVDYLDFARQMEKKGVKKIIFTDIETDGTLQGPSLTRLAELQRAVCCDIIASGGVSCNRDVRILQEMGMYGAIIGKAFYSGAIDLKQAVEEGGPQC